MPQENHSRIPDLLAHHEPNLLKDWLKQLSSNKKMMAGSLDEGELRKQFQSFLQALVRAAQKNGIDDPRAPSWDEVRETLTDVSHASAKQGLSPSETATFVFSLKQPLFDLLRREAGKDPESLGNEMQKVSNLLDQLGLYTTEAHQKRREEVIIRQQQEMMELSTPVVKLWDGILALPLIGTLDSERTQVVMESLLEEIVRTGASIAIIDITGVPTVDTLVAQHLLKTVAAARLMGADCIISGIRPQIASTIVHLGVELGNVITKATLADAFGIALRRMGMAVVKSTGPADRF